MEEWKFITLMVTVVAFSLQFRPLDSFLTAYLSGPEVKFTLNEVSKILTPIQIYSSVLGSLLMFLLTDYFRYKPVVVFNGFIGMVAYFNLADSPRFFQVVIAECCVSVFFFTEVLYYSYLYAKIKRKEHYEMATGYVKAAMLSGKCASDLMGQLIVLLNFPNGYSTLPYYSLAGMAFSFVWACFLPSVKHSQYCHSKKAAEFSQEVIRDPNILKYTVEENIRTQDFPDKNETTTVTGHVKPFKRIYDDFMHSYEDSVVRKWSFWFVISYATYGMIYLYMNILFSYLADLNRDQTMLYNGFVNAITNLSGAICSYKVGKLDLNWDYHCNTFLGIGSLVLGTFICLCAYFEHINFAYIMSIGFGTLLPSMFVITTSQIAKRLKDDCYALVLGFNTFVGLLLSTCTTLFLVQIVRISIPMLFLFYGSIYVALGVLYGTVGLFKDNTINIGQ